MSCDHPKVKAWGVYFLHERGGDWEGEGEGTMRP